MLSKLRPLVTKAFTPLARLLHRLGVKPDMITIFGTVATSTVALWLIPAGHLLLASLLIALFALFDSVDGILARLTGTSGPWGAFLDSTLDRVADGAIFGGILLFFVVHPVGLAQRWGAAASLACLVLGSVIPYAKARAASVGVEVRSGLFERATRLAFTLVPLALAQFWLPPTVLAAALSLLAVGLLSTVLQRMGEVRAKLRAGATTDADAGEPQ